MRHPIRLLAPLLAALVVAGCADRPVPHIVIPQATGATPNAAAAPQTSAIPRSVDIPSIGVHATGLVPLGLNKDGSIQTPDVDHPQVMGWYTRGAHLCMPGPDKVPAALLGHVNDVHQPGVLVNLNKIKTGDIVTIGLSDGSSCKYRITELATIKKLAFSDKSSDGLSQATQKVWGDTPNAQLRIISCGGKYIGAPLYYESNIVAMATLVS